MEKSESLLTKLFRSLCLCILLFTSCDNKQSEEELIAKAVEIKIDVYRDELRASCRQELLEEAEKIADSLVLSQVNIKMDRSKPYRPERPLRPSIDFQDTISIKDISLPKDTAAVIEKND